MKISDFTANFSPYGMARANRYSIIITTPNSILEHVNDLPKILMFCDSINLPGLNINTAQIRTFGEMREMPYEFNYDPIQVSFYVDGEMLVKDFFDRWINSIQRGETRSLNYYTHYICPQMQIFVEDLEDIKTYQVELYEVYPKTVSAIQMGYDQKDIMKVQITLMYKYWKSSMHDGEFKFNSTEYDVKADFSKTQKVFNDQIAEIGNNSALTGITKEEFMFNATGYQGGVSGDY
jgi:hypothetical protein